LECTHSIEKNEKKPQAFYDLGHRESLRFRKTSSRTRVLTSVQSCTPASLKILLNNHQPGYTSLSAARAGLHAAVSCILRIMSDDFVEDPTPEQQKVVLVDAETVAQAQGAIVGCEACSEDAEIPFVIVLDQLTDSDPSVTDYVLEVPARCLQCGAEINEKTLVELA
jgi:hypothetical protein